MEQNSESPLYVGNYPPYVEATLQGGGNNIYGLDDGEGEIAGVNRWICLWIIAGLMLLCIMALPFLVRSRRQASPRRGNAWLVGSLTPRETAPIPATIAVRSNRLMRSGRSVGRTLGSRQGSHVSSLGEVLNREELSYGTACPYEAMEAAGDKLEVVVEEPAALLRWLGSVQHDRRREPRVPPERA